MTRLHVTTAIAAALVVMTIPAIAVAGAASAAPSKWEPVHEVFGPEVTEDFCEVPGLTVEQTVVVDGRARTATHGPDGLSHMYEFVTDTVTTTNLATMDFVTRVATQQFHDVRVTDNGDGTLTVRQQATGTIIFYDQDGQVLSRGAGQFAFEFLIDHAGTPSDPSDDVFLGFQRVVRQVGKQVDICDAAVLQAID